MTSRDPIAKLIQKYRQKGLLVDSNLLLLFLVGTYDSSLIESFKRTKSAGFTVEDFNRLKSLMERFDRIVTTPHILTEISNLSKFPDEISSKYFKRFSASILTFHEKFVPARKFCEQENFIEFGLTDAGIVDLAKNRWLMVTAEFPLSNYLHTKGIDVINFNHLRSWILP